MDAEKFVHESEYAAEVSFFRNLRASGTIDAGTFRLLEEAAAERLHPVVRFDCADLQNS